MNEMEQVLNHAGRAQALPEPGGLIARIRRWAADYATYRRTVGELRSLSDRELADLGISPMAIEDVARAAVYGDR